MSSELKPPILLFGNNRSGTTIVQKVMATHPDIVPWYEPRNLWLFADPARPHDEFDESDATDRVKRYIRWRFLRFQKRHGNRRVLEKSPANILKIRYAAAIFPEAILMFIVRDPFSFISSLEVKWQRPVSLKGIGRHLMSTPKTQLHFYVGRVLRQQFEKRILRRKYLSLWGPRYKGMDEDLKIYDLATVIAKQWAECSRRAERDMAGFADGRILRLKYETFVEQPVAELERICAHSGLSMTNEMVRAANEWVKSDRQQKWRRFDPRDLARLLPELEDEMRRHGYPVPTEIVASARNPYRDDGEPAGTPRDPARRARRGTQAHGDALASNALLDR
jgi:hypothetical protein